MGVDEDIKDAQSQRSNVKGAALTGAGSDFDQDIYGGGGSEAGGLTELPTEAEEASMGADQGADGGVTTSQRRNYSGPSLSAADDMGAGADEDPFAVRAREMGVQPTIAERESDYQARRRNRILSPARADPFAAGGTADPEARTYADVMKETELSNEKEELLRAIKAKKEDEEAAKASGADATTGVGAAGTLLLRVHLSGAGTRWGRATVVERVLMSVLTCILLLCSGRGPQSQEATAVGRRDGRDACAPGCHVRVGQGRGCAVREQVRG